MHQMLPKRSTPGLLHLPRSVERLVAQRFEPAPHFSLIALPVMSDRFERRIVGWLQLAIGTPGLERNSAETFSPAPFLIEFMDEGGPKIPDGGRSVFDQNLGNIVGRLEDA